MSTYIKSWVGASEEEYESYDASKIWSRTNCESWKLEWIGKTYTKWRSSTCEVKIGLIKKVMLRISSFWTQMNFKLPTSISQIYINCVNLCRQFYTIYVLTKLQLLSLIYQRKGGLIDAIIILWIICHLSYFPALTQFEHMRI